MVDLTQIIIAILTLAFSCISAFLVPYLKTKVDAEKLGTIKLWTKIAVEAAEMLYVGSGKGEEKKAYVADYLAGKGFKLNFEDVETLIESAVLELKQI